MIQKVIDSAKLQTVFEEKIYLVSLIVLFSSSCSIFFRKN